MSLPLTAFRLSTNGDAWTGTLLDEWVNGRAGNDVLDGGAGDDRLDGNAGDDTLSGGLGDDRLYGGIGNDQLFGGEGNDRLNGGLGDDVLNGGAGDDHAVFKGARSDYQITRKADGSVEVKDLRTSADNIGADTLIGVERIKFTDGMFATDVLAPKPVGPTAGDDVLNGTANNDTIDGLAGNDVIDGDGGNDTLTGGAGADKIYGGAGSDAIYADAADTVIDGGAGLDGVFFTEAVNLTAATVLNVELLRLGAGDDVIDLSGMQTRGEPGMRLTVADGVSGYGVRYEGGVAIDTGGGNNTVVGSQFGDTIYGAGNLNGGGGNDILYAVGASHLSGGAGNDLFVSQSSGVTMQGGEGNDLYDFRHTGNQFDAVIEDFSVGDRIGVSVRSDGYVTGGHGMGLAGISVEAHAQGALVTLGHDGIRSKIVLVGVTAADVTADMFVFGW